MPTVSPDSFGALIIAAKSKDASALAELIGGVRLEVRRFVMFREHNPATAEDIEQETLRIIVEKLSSCESCSWTQFNAWALGIARNLLRQHIDKQTKLRAKTGRVHETTFEAHASDPRQEQLANLRQALTQLSPDHQEIVELRYIQGRKPDEIATLLAIPYNTVLSRTHSARKVLRQLLSGGAHHG